MVKRITKELLFKRAEHNEGELSTLQEITLHQFDLARIELLDTFCRDLEIVYLQNNQILAIENVNKLKKLRYLNLALNNIKRIDNLQGCESLRKLDLTVNFVDDFESIENLRWNRQLRELYLIGNPIADKDGYREFAVNTLPQLEVLDSKPITRSERILAKRAYPGICAKHGIEPKESEIADDFFFPFGRKDSAVDELGVDAEAKEDEDLDEIRSNFQTKPVEHTREARLAAARDMDKMHAKPEPKPDPLMPAKKPAALFAKDGTPLQRNEGKLVFKLDDTASTVLLQVEISKFIDTSLVDVDVQPAYARVTVKGKALQLILPAEVAPDSTVAERSQTTGALRLLMLKAGVSPVSATSVDVARVHREEMGKRSAAMRGTASEAAFGDKDKPREQVAAVNRRMQRLGLAAPAGGSVDYRRIVNAGRGGSDGAVKPDIAVFRERAGATAAARREAVKQPHDDFVDDPDVPPLM